MKIPEGLYGITSADFGMSHVKTAEILLSNGVKIVQFRPKGDYSDTKGGSEKKESDGMKIKELCRKHNGIFIVNDDVELAKKLDADGVHLGQKDLIGISPSVLAKSFVDRIIGISVVNIEQATEAIEKYKAAYLGAGAVYPSVTKNDSEVMKDSHELGDIVEAAKPVPVIAIGGIGLDKTALMKRRYHVHGIALISAIFGSRTEEGSTDAIRRFEKEWESA